LEARKENANHATANSHYRNTDKTLNKINHKFLRSHLVNIKRMASEDESIYERVARLEDEVASLRHEIDVLKGTMRNKIVRYEHKLIKKGKDVQSIID
jgi:predicted  nucleic acid-binding Zn-ribbon protein